MKKIKLNRFVTIRLMLWACVGSFLGFIISKEVYSPIVGALMGYTVEFLFRRNDGKKSKDITNL